MVGKPLAEPTRSAIDAAAFTTVIICLFNDAVQESNVLSQSQAGSTVLPCANVKHQEVLEPKCNVPNKLV